MNSGIILAAGNSVRLNHDKPKQFIEINQIPIFLYSVNTFLSHPQIDDIIIVIPEKYYNNYCLKYPDFTFIVGGKTRAESVSNALNFLNQNTKNVLIHDGARPFIDTEIIDNCLELLNRYKAVTPVLPAINTIVKIKNNIICEMPDRNELYEEQTPQGFDFLELKKAYIRFQEDATDDIKVVFQNQVICGTFIGSERNIKITHDFDLRIAKLLLGDNEK